MSEKKLFGVAGSPILHSKSPEIFNYIFKQMGLDYNYIRLFGKNLSEVLDLFKKLNMKGLNVTAPFKEEIISQLNKIDSVSKQIGAVNTIINKNGEIWGYNTDHLGVVNALRYKGLELRGKNCLLLGAGGAAKAALYALSNEKALVTIINRTFAKGEKLASKYSCRAEKIENLEREIKRNDIFLSTLGDGAQIINESWLKKNITVLDANYKNSTLKEMIHKKGGLFISGLYWLIYQALGSLEIFTGQSFTDVDNLKKQLFLEKSSRKNISLIGFMGTGKTSLGKSLATKMNMEHIDTDLIIEKKENRSIEKIFSEKGEKYFREIEADLIHDLKSVTGKIISYGGGAILNEENRKTISENSISIWLYASSETSVKRTQESPRPLLTLSNPNEIASKILKERLELYAESSDIVVDTDNKNIEELSGKIYEEFSQAL